MSNLQNNLNYLIKRILRSLFYRSGIMIDINNRIKRELFENEAEINAFLQIQNLVNLIKSNFLQTKLKFLGNMNIDGTYPVLQSRNYENKILLSFGVGNNIVLERHGAKLGMEVHTFDHTTSAKIPNKFKDKIHYHPVGITGSEPIPECLNLSEILKVYNISFEKIEILKLDIEGCEWDVLSSDLDVISLIPQLIIEFHNLEKITNLKESYLYFITLQKVFETHQMVYISPNNFSSFVTVNNVIWPFTFEAVFVSKSILDHTFTKIFDPVKFLEDQVTNRDVGPEINLLSWWR
jgi:hypothetical protein